MSGTRLFVLCVAFVVPALCAAATIRPSTPMVVGYVFPQDAALQPGEIDALSLTRINYAFANIANGRIVTGFSDDAKNLAFLRALKRQNPSLTILVSVGGWLWSTNFSDVALTPESRKVFIRSVTDFLTRYDLDGLDIDWEYPDMLGSGHPFRAEDKQTFTLLLKELRQQFNRETKRTHRKLYLTIAAGASNEYLAHTQMSKVQKYVDTVNLMTYDYYEPGSDSTTGHHAPLFTNTADPKRISGEASVLAFEQAGVSAAKILLGVPFYGYIWGQVAENNHGLFRAGKPVPKGYAPYSLITETMLNHGFIRYWDPIASAPYLYSSEKQIFVSYEDPESLAAKCRYVLTHKLGGVMFWDYSGDPSGTLLGVINQTLQKQATKGAQTR